jgi:hypothetical protein
VTEKKFMGEEVDSLYYAEYFHKPILLKEKDYSKNSQYIIRVDYKWYNSPARDYTVKVYSKMDVPVKDSNGKLSITHMDGQVPSGFTSSSFVGMDGRVDNSGN